MEELRLQGNAHVASGEPDKAVTFYLQAMDIYEDTTTSGASKTLDEYTKSAGNALTCLLKVKDRAACIQVAKRALQVNSIFGKANAAWGRCLLEEPSLYEEGEGPHTAFMLLCRAVYELPALEDSSRPFLAEAIENMLRDRRHVPANDSLDDALDVRKGSCGFGVMAQKDIPPFTEVSSTLRPFSVSVYEETEGKGCCVNCGCVLHETMHASSLPCPTCKMVFYCSPSCFESHKATHAQYECAPLIKLKRMAANVEAQQLDVPEEFFETAFHCITTFSSIRAGREGHTEVFALEAHADEVAQRFPMVPLVHDLLPSEARDAVAKIVGIIRCNALEISDSTGLGVGQSLFVGKGNITSFFNHSCAPNCAIDAERNCICTVRRVYKGEELTIAYMPQLYWPAKLRQNALAERYFFSCRCERCERSLSDPFEKAIVAVQTASRQDATKYYHAQVQTACAAVRCRGPDDLGEQDVRRLEALLEEMLQHLFPFHYLCHEVRNTLTFLYSVMGDEDRCLSSCLQELLLWECIVPGALPVKQMKIRNALCCLSDVAAGTESPLTAHIGRLGILYDVAEEEKPSA